MLESLRPGNALLAALAAWSLALVLLALLGLGANFGPHPDNPGLAPPVPVVQLSEVGRRLGPLSSYDEVGRRPLLTPDRRPSAVGSADGEEKPFDFELTGVLLAGDFKAALLQSRDGSRSQRVRIGEMVPGTGWRLVSLEPRSAAFDGPQGRQTLDLRVYDGSADASLARATPAASGDNPPGPGPETSPREQPASADAPADADEQVQAIRRRIEARRAQLREEAARRNGQKVE